MVKISKALNSQDAVYYLLTNPDLWTTLKRYPVDLFIVTIIKEEKLYFIIYDRTLENFEIEKSTYTIKQINTDYIEGLKGLLGTLTINQEQSNQNFKFRDKIEEIKTMGKLLFDKLIPEKIQKFIKEELEDTLFLSIQEKNLVDKIVKDLRNGKTEELAEEFKKKQTTGRLTIMDNENEKNEEWEIFEELDREDQSTYFVYRIKKKDEVLNIYRSIDSVWIMCDPEEIEPLWELLYMKHSDKDFFWGERFSIAKVPSGYNFAEPRIQINDDKIKAAIIRDEAKFAKEEEDYLDLHVNLAVKVTRCADIENSMRESLFHIVHIAAHYMDKKLLKKDKIGLGQINRCESSADIVFMNTCNSEISSNIDFVVPIKLADEFKNKKAWVGTNWTIVGYPASDFAKCFYDNFLHGIPIARSVKEARKKIRDTNIMYLAYTVYGHPFTRLVQV